MSGLGIKKNIPWRRRLGFLIARDFCVRIWAAPLLLIAHAMDEREAKRACQAVSAFRVAHPHFRAWLLNGRGTGAGERDEEQCRQLMPILLSGMSAETFDRYRRLWARHRMLAAPPSGWMEHSKS